MKNIIIILLVVSVGIYLLSQKGKETEADSMVIQRQLIINALDGSGTTKGKDWPWPDKAFFEEQISFLESNGGGVLEVINLSSKIPSSIKVEIYMLKDVPDVYSGEQAVKEAENYNLKISSKNENSKKVFFGRLEKEILNYEPSKGSDYSYVEKNLTAVKKKLLVPQYSEYQSFLLIYSDLLNHTPNQKPRRIDESIIDDLNSYCNLAVCDLNFDAKNDLSCTTISSYREFTGFVQSFSNN